MTILHAWLNVRDGNAGTLSLIDALNQHEGIGVTNSGMNGEVVYHFLICHNHHGSSFEYFFKAVNNLAEIESPDTYGLIYMFDDEHKEFYDEWQVWVLSKNKVVKTKDCFLSPYSEKVAWYSED